MNECRQKLKAEGKPYPRSGCAICGQWSPRWKECDANFAVNQTPPQPICLEFAQSRDKAGGSVDAE